MISPLDFIADLTNPALAFLPRALLVAALSSALCGLVGTHMVVRGMAFAGDAISHAVFPGLAISFVLGGSLFLGGVIGGVAVAVIIALFAQRRVVGEDSVIGVFFAASFALGLVVLSKSQAYAGSLASFLSGSITGVNTRDIVVTIIAFALIAFVLAVLHHSMVLASLDRDMARAAGVKVLVVDLVLYVAVAGAVVVAVHTVGNILVLALLITPPATARLLVHRLVPMMALSMTCGVISSVIGIYAAWSLDIPAGAAIVLVSTLLFICAWALRPLRALRKV
ncbi:Manganese transport system membrane protein MntB [Corynebacterium ciconiae DSM 44920]|uniref:anchored repeat-type ABC transporter permease subunit n=1 Tax=Corynebacterium ciconiae TaxID=227319 RepID=UPI00036BE730|nr:anchored repeat-type ABC transporter permease subunit [Corynebacterium ciconiae]WKD60172.1 Manganese transport system membrane protein MntB [Corynebacterium ciconiae DSM 44920]